jgi:hypothetical protein
MSAESTKIGGLFVWVKGSRGPIPEKWGLDMPEGAKKDKIVLAQHEISPGDFAMSILILEQRYPLETMK